MGDSFTEGDGVDYENSYPSFLQRKLSEKYTNIEVLNAGKRGSDPFFNYKYLVDTLIAYQPDMIVQSFTANDYYFDMVIRGGLERFGEDGQLKYRYHYWWESIYASSFVFRIFIQAIGGYDQFLIKKSTFNQSLNEMKLKSIELFREYKRIADMNDFKLIVFTIPFVQDFTKKGNEDFYNLFSPEFLQSDIPFYNLQSCYNDYVQSHQTQIKNYYWKKDGHHNAKGYEMMASCIEDIVSDQMDR